MKLKVPNNVGIEFFELDYKPVSLEIYLAQFNRDLTQDVLGCVQKYGGLTRSLTLRLIWTLSLTANPKFMHFIDFINAVEYNINDFLQTWGIEFDKWFMELINKDLS